MGDFELVTLASGIKSLRCTRRRETFHPVTGPRVEANILHVRQQRLVERCAVTPRFVIWDVGFGAAANALTAIEALRAMESPPASTGVNEQVELHSFDVSTGPIEFTLRHAQELGYVLGYEGALQTLLAHGQVELGPRLRWHLHLGDFRELVHDPRWPSPHAIFYDPYSPARNVDMWTLDHFSALHKRLDPRVPCLLSNYTCSTSARATLALAGFYVGTGCGVGEKVETTLASNSLELLPCPFGARWLSRARASHSAAPLRGPVHVREPMSDEDFARLAGLPQFQSAIAHIPET